jgi:hypothetical protein
LASGLSLYEALTLTKMALSTPCFSACLRATSLLAVG